MSKKDPEPFIDVDFPRERAYRLADHEVLMAFNGDSYAAAFHDWWDEEGAVLFQDWLNRQVEKQ